jgi:hypothetical protein
MVGAQMQIADVSLGRIAGKMTRLNPMRTFDPLDVSLKGSTLS